MASGHYSAVPDQTVPGPADTFSFASVPWRAESPTEGPCIRLLELGPRADRTSPLSGSLFWTALSSPSSVPFKALSYVWGTGGFTSTIYINGQEFKITSSLEQALQHILNPSESLIIWIDQICINQQDDKEKSRQVAQMGRIYETAEETLAWLGPAENNSDLFMDISRRAGKELEDWGIMEYCTSERIPVLFQMFHGSNGEDPQAISFDAICARIVPEITREFLQSKTEWFQRPWFSRVWVIQEISLSPKATFICGHQRISLHHALFAYLYFHGACLSLFRGGFLDSSTLFEATSTNSDGHAAGIFETWFQTRKFAAGLASGTTLCDLLFFLYEDTKFQATEPCDLIWGVLGLAEDRERLEFQPNFERKDQVELIYTQVTKSMVEKDSLDFIASIRLPKTSEQLPSWVPDFRVGLQSSMAMSRYLPRYRYAASKDLSPIFLPTNDVSILGLRGFIIDSIDATGHEWNIEPDSCFHMDHSLLKEVAIFCDISDRRCHDIYVSDTRREEAKWRVPIADRYLKNGTTSCPESWYAKYYEEYVLKVEEPLTPLSELASVARSDIDVSWGDEGVSSYGTNMNHVDNKKPFLSRVGYVGMGPLSMQSKDTIVVFRGAQVPYIVRRLEGGNWSLVGECYCYGIMQGENLKSRQETDFYLV